MLLVCDVFQVLFHLTQFTSAALNPRRPCSPLVSGTKPSRPQQGTTSQNEGDFEMCSHSLNTVSIITEGSCDFIRRLTVILIVAFVLFSGPKQLQ
jgi:hypothetical protein